MVTAASADSFYPFLCRRKERDGNGHGDMDSMGGKAGRLSFERSDDFPGQWLKV